MVGTIEGDNTVTDDSGAVCQTGDTEKGQHVSAMSGQKVEAMSTLEENASIITIGHEFL